MWVFDGLICLRRLWGEERLTENWKVRLQRESNGQLGGERKAAGSLSQGKVCPQSIAEEAEGRSQTLPT